MLSIVPQIEIEFGAPDGGPRRWWGGPLDVEGLTLASTGLAAGAVNTLLDRPGALRVSPQRVGASFDSLGHLRIDGRAPVGFAPLSGFFPTADGWIRTHANYPHHARRLCAALGARPTAESLAATLREFPATEAERVVGKAGGVAAAVRTRQEWLNSPMSADPSPREWIFVDVHPVKAGKWCPGTDLPLTGLRVLDLTRVVAGPVAARTLAALGADVLRLDPPQLPELTDQHIDSGFGRRTALLDLGTDPGRLADLLERADVLLLGYRNGALDRYGLGPATLGERYPGLAVVGLDAWGTRGPWAVRRGFDSIVQAAVGIADVYRHTDGRPGALPVQALDHATGYGMVAAAIGLVDARRRHGLSGTARLSLVRAADLLFRTRVPQLPICPTEPPQLSRTNSTFGELRYLPTPFDLDGKVLDYPHAPHAYGADDPTW